MHVDAVGARLIALEYEQRIFAVAALKRCNSALLVGHCVLQGLECVPCRRPAHRFQLLEIVADFLHPSQLTDRSLAQMLTWIAAHPTTARRWRIDQLPKLHVRFLRSPGPPVTPLALKPRPICPTSCRS
ncbi:protein of unknown function [Burkholderia multivorans]